MVFHLIGLGLGDPTDITVRGLEIVKKCTRVYLESYTSILSAGKDALEKFYGREVIVADREQVEQNSDDILEGAAEEDIALLVVGDPFSATTHTDLALRAHGLNIPFQVINNASIMTAVGCTGLQLYRFGETVSIPFWADGWEPESFFDKINQNLYSNLHTLCLLDIKVKEQSLENYLKGRKIFEPPRFLRINQAAEQLLTIIARRIKKSEIIESNQKDIKDVETDPFVGLNENTICIAAVRVGTKTQKIIKSTLKEMSEEDFGEPLHSLIICAEMHPIEDESIQLTNSTDLNENEETNHFSIIGLGLGQPSDITIKGLEAVKRANKVYLEGYTSIIDGGKECIEKFLEKDIIVAERELVEQESNEIFNSEENIAFLVIGDPLGATTHMDLVLRAKEKGFSVEIIHNASIINAVGCCGLQLYSFGEIISIPFWKDNWKPDSFYDKICRNLENGWHTLCLLDIKVKEQTDENLVKGLKIYEPPRYMTAAQAASQLVQIIKDREKCGQAIPLHCGHKVIALARVGTDSQVLKTTSLQEMVETDIGGPLHSLVIVGQTHPLEDEYISIFS